MLKITGSGVAVGILAACQFGPILLLSAWAGAVADRSDKRKLLLVTQSLEMVQSAGLAVLAFMAHPPLVGLYALAVGGGTLLAFDNPLRRSFVTEMVRAEDIPNAVVLYSVIVNVARIFGPALAGLLVVTVGYGWCFTIDAASYLAVLLCLVMMRHAELRRRPRQRRGKGEVREGLRYVMSLPSLWISFVMLVAVQTLAYNFTVTLPLFVTDALHSTGGAFTILYSLFGSGAVVSALIVAHRGLVRLRHIIVGAAALGLAMLLLASVPGVGLAAPGGVSRRHGEHPLPDRHDGDGAGRSSTRDARAGPVTADGDLRRRDGHRRPRPGAARRQMGRTGADRARRHRLPAGRHLRLRREPPLRASGGACELGEPEDLESRPCPRQSDAVGSHGLAPGLAADLAVSQPEKGIAMRYRYFTCDVFTDTRFGGNQLAVLPEAAGLGPEQMQQVAREFNYSETTFVLPAEAGHDCRVRIFTPMNEVPFAGHPNIGTAFVLAGMGVFGAIGEPREVTFEEQAGLVAVTIERRGEERIWCELTAPQRLTLGPLVAVRSVAAAVSLADEDILTTSHAPRVVSVGLPFVIAELKDRDALERARPDLAGFESLVSQGVDPPDVHLYVRTSDGFDLRASMFSPLDGIPEDPATGSANCALAGLLSHLDAAAGGQLWLAHRARSRDGSTQCPRGSRREARRPGRECVDRRRMRVGGEGLIDV